MKHKILLSFLSVCCITAGTIAQSIIDATIQHDDLTREYRLYIPDIYDGSEAVPLVFNFHGYGSNNIQQTFYGEFRPIADTANFIIVLPQGSINDSNSTFWNTFGGPETVDDVGFTSALIDTIAAAYNVDLNRVYSTGMSNGGFMSYKLACELSNRITAIASVTGSMIVPELDACSPPRPVPVMQIHGTADDVVPYEGGGGFVHVDTLVKAWTNFNNCDPNPVFTAIPDINMDDGCTAEHYLYESGDLGSTVEFYKVIDGEHTWPNTIINIGVTNRDFDASQEIWRFFSQYELGNFVTSIENPLPELLTTPVFPNPSDGKFILNFREADEKTVVISNNLGQELKRFIVSNDQFEFTLAESGIYFVTVTKGQQSETQKLVVY